jgi:hypothetical protein
MARLSPDTEKTRVIFSSSAEEQFYEQARATLGNAWRVYYSVTLSAIEGNDGQKDNEMDFVCYHPQWGIVVVEVKGGRIRHDAQTGAYFSINRHGESFEIKDPFQQALVWKSRFIRFLKNHDTKVPVTHAVCFPGANEDEFPVSAGTNREMIIGRNRMKDLDASLRSIVEKAQPEQYRKFPDCAAKLDDLLLGSTFTTKLYLRDYIDSHEHRLKDVESIHETLITPIASSRRLGIEGEAGTGKTMLAVMLAKTFRAQSKSVLMLGSNALLNLLLKRDLGADIDAMTYPEMAQSFGVNLLIPPQEHTGAKEDWIQYEAPERLKKAIATSSKRWDVIICDEAQDVQPFWWEAIESLMKPDSPDMKEGEGSRFYLFFDSSQGVFGSGGGDQKFVAAEVLPVRPPYFPLVHNYRTTREIATFSRAFRTSTTILQSHCGRLGYVPELIVYKDAEDAKRLLGKLLKKLHREEGMALNELTILSARNPAARESVLYQTDAIDGISIHKLSHSNKQTWKEAKAPENAVAVSTIAGFKGMETSVGIMMNVSEYNLPLDNAIMASLVYVACTRAKHMLYIFVQADDAKRQKFEQALAAIKTTGALVLEGSKADFEFSGRVSHYNPERVGWLTVDDPAFTQGSIMFFPSDVQAAALKDVKVGTRLKFRPRVEGSTTIAADLIIVPEAKKAQTA